MTDEDIRVVIPEHIETKETDRRISNEMGLRAQGKLPPEGDRKNNCKNDSQNENG